MKFAELRTGDWFQTARADDGIIWIKTGEARCRPINYNGNKAIDLADGCVSNIDFEVVFCPRYVWDDGTCADYCDFGACPDNLEPVKSIDAIPIGAVYKGLGNAYYRKISETKSFTIWTENPDAIGRICVFKPNLVGMFSICHFFNFSFPEMT